MDELSLKKFTYILISRYLTYILIYIGSIIIIEDDIKSVAILTLIFLAVLATSSLRIYK